MALQATEDPRDDLGVLGRCRVERLNQSTHSRVAYSTSSMPFQGPRRRIRSVKLIERPCLVLPRRLGRLADEAGDHRGTGLTLRSSS
jgi:hypothetical protein